MIKHKLKILFKCKKLLNFFFKYDNFLFLNFNYYNKLNYFNFLTFLYNNKFDYYNFLKLNSKKINIINNSYFFNNINTVISFKFFSEHQKYTKEFINIFTSYNNENIDFVYFKFKEFNSLISFFYFIEFLKNKNKKIIFIKLLKIIYFPIIYLIKNNKIYFKKLNSIK
jgi:hypothetical protein